MRNVLEDIDHRRSISKPYRVDWNTPPTSLYNICIENAFCADFWASVEGGQYDIAMIPARYRDRESFVGIYRRHLLHLRKCWASQVQPPPESQKTAKAKHYARNSRMGTVCSLMR